MKREVNKQVATIIIRLNNMMNYCLCKEKNFSKERKEGALLKFEEVTNL